MSCYVQFLEKGFTMTNLMKKATALTLAVVLIFSLAIISHGAEIVPLDDDSVFQTQKTNYTCTLVSAVMLFRRGALINRDPNWTDFNEDNCRYSSWWPGGLSWYLSGGGMVARAHKMTEFGLKMGDLEGKRAWFIEQLALHPEGIMIFCQFSSNNAHAVLLTDYDAETDTFYCGDPSPVYPRKRIPLGESELPWHTRKAGYQKGNLSNQDYVIQYIYQVWMIESGIDYESYYAEMNPETPMMAEEVFSETWVTDTGDSHLNVRSGASTSFSKIGSLPNGTTVTVTKKHDGWGYIEQEGLAGWISLEYANMVSDNRIVLTMDSKEATVDGKTEELPAAPVFEDDLVKAPLRFVAESLDAEIAWNGETGEITVTKDETVIVMTVDSSAVTVNGNTVTSPSAISMKDGVAYAPCRFLAENLDATVYWNPEIMRTTIVR